MENISKTKGIDLNGLSIERLERLLKTELYINIDSPFAVELMAEINRRKEILESTNG
jgi:hypothetical protein